MRRAVSATNKHWSETQKIEAVQAFIMFGKVPMVETLTGIPRGTIAQWKLQDWWKDLETELRNADDIELSAKLKRVIDKSVDVVGDRLENGDFVYNQKTGSLMRKPVSIRDAHQVLKDSIDKRRVLDNKPTNITEHKIEDRLLDLKKKFEEFALSFQKQEKVIEGEVIPVEQENAIHDERETGLQEGVRLDQEDRGDQENLQESAGPT